MSTHTDLWKRAECGFTLVELLVVIAIIGTLVGLLMPAVNSVRENARRTNCLNNEHEVATSLLTYEASHGRFPGYLNPAMGGGTTNTTNWAIPLLPNMGRNDLWTSTGTGTGSASWQNGLIGASGLVPAFVCPDDTAWATIASTSTNAPISYIVNANPGVFQNRVNATTSCDLTLSQISRTPQIIMLGEKYSAPLNGTASTNGFWSQATTASLAQNYLTFSQWTSSLQTTFTTSYYQATSHPNIINVVFFDGHGLSLKSNTNTSSTSQYLPGP